MKKEKENIQDRKVQSALSKLGNLYKTMPDTKGCMEHINLSKEDGGCGGWCCKHQNPSVLYVEFLNTWKSILKLELPYFVAFFELALRNYLSDKPTKGCMFWDDETKLCRQHATRPYNCRIYGVTPEEDFKPRFEKLKVIYKDSLGAVIKDQCDLVSTVDGKIVTKDDIDKWWNELREIEKSIGIKESEITDQIGGTYRTYHDHMLLKICNDDMMNKLQILRLHGNKMEKELAIKDIIDNLRNNLESSVKRMSENEPAKAAVPISDKPNDEPTSKSLMVGRAKKFSILKGRQGSKE